MMDSLNRQRTYQNSRVPHTPNNKEYALEESNTVVVKHKRMSISRKLKKMFKGQHQEKSE